MKQINVSDETYNKIKDQIIDAPEASIETCLDMIGQKWFLRTVTYHWVGLIISVTAEGWFELDNASWVADSGRFSDAIKKGTLSEVEPVGKAFVNSETCVDMIQWKHPLPTEQK